MGLHYSHQGCGWPGLCDEPATETPNSGAWGASGLLHTMRCWGRGLERAGGPVPLSTIHVPCAILHASLFLGCLLMTDRRWRAMHSPKFYKLF